MPPSDARRILGPERIIGFSTHNPDQLRAAAAEPADYLAIGPIFGNAIQTAARPRRGPRAAWRNARPLSERPLVAIGGITRANAPEVLAAGADSVAVIADLLPESSTEQTIRERMEEWQQPPQVSQTGLVKGLGLLDATTLVMGSMIGSGIFIVAADISRQVGSPGLLIVTWVVTAVLTIIAALSYGELAAAMPQRRRAVRLPARSLRPAQRLPLRLDPVPGDPDRHHRRRGRGVRQVRRRLLPLDLARSNYLLARPSASTRSNWWPSR